jgi:beta-N-acetylhexosaminidase
VRRGHSAPAACCDGLDLISCAAGDVTQGQDATAGLASALDSGQLNPAGFAAALQRVTSLRAALR